ncbi:hypothetical protein DESUT3_22390 [Desulfuromonas versatilis]|uniref:FAD dependent oxidoreductase n=1 Tax=Desulfuromonas versatilis TaxID=2802975 RepID=A0ABN6DYR4_9BACT|nr:hypothetical protein [Desulfuromonas versatilis]BCR05170.1 hypothetical protein DESUT3_22390 [Desulfuromonas versatilis]
MSQYYYDVIIAGQSLAATLAGTLLARGGCRVLSISAPVEPPKGWLSSSFHLEKVLEGMGGRSCFAPPVPFQVLTDQVRLEVLGSCPFEDELRREFPDNFSAVSGLFQDLQALGQRLEQTLWDAGGLPLLGLSSRLRFFRKGLGKQLSLRALAKPLASRWAGIRHAPTRNALETLFAGLALADPGKLSLAEGALLWSGAHRPDGISSQALLEFLQLRFEQFHGVTEDPGKMRPLEHQGERITGLSVKEGARCAGGHFILADRSMLKYFPERIAARIKSSPRPVQRSAVEVQGEKSPLLAPRVILQGSSPLRLEIASGTQDISSVLEYRPCDGDPEFDPAAMHQRLGLAFPFARMEFPDLPSTPGEASGATGASNPRLGFPGAFNRLQLGHNSWLCHGESVLPHLGAIGEMLVGVAVANHLLRIIKPRK